MPEAWDTLRLFMALGTQWRFAGMDGQPMGIDYAAIAPTAAGLGIETTAERFEDLRVMESVALAAWREKRR